MTAPVIRLVRRMIAGMHCAVETRFDTDKYESGYVPFYIERVKAPRRILEVGVKNGGSLLLWCQLWPSVEQIIGIDLRPPLENLHPKITVLQADQTDIGLLDQIGQANGPFELIIDDASHIDEASWKTFRAM